ncbi:AIPR family protein [Bacillus altitudinis]|uniref:AIPR family protein n=1 Tax=Bacillus altitudinis TaxID=293387 RepID=UPI001C38249A|nr:AIPR family protein [Bacillus altitudinis]MBV5111055.1 AIPR family protein [Bacillus altitudinis]MBW2728367.1 AIPR family protein [Bacillus altitudinis]
MSNQLTLLNVHLDDYITNSQFDNSDKAFEVFATEQIFKDQDIAIDEVSVGLIGDSKDYGIDGVYIYLNDELINNIEEVEIHNKMNLDLHFLQYKNTNTIHESVIDKFIVATDFIFDLDQDLDSIKDAVSINLIEKMNLIHTIIKKIAIKHPKINITFYHVCKGDRRKIKGQKYTNHSYLNKIKILRDKTLESNLGKMDFDYKIIDAEVLLNLLRKEPDYSIALKLNENPIAIDYRESDQRGYIASVNVVEYYKFLCDPVDNSLRKYLFESNIRDFQNNTSVNNDIAETLKEKNEFDFWWLNNGITIIAENGTLVGKTLQLENIQIVNGLQTSHTLYNSFSTDLPETETRSILLKIIITDKKETMDTIIKSNNSHNPVPPALLRATHKVQRDIEDYFLANGYYYDRRKNYYRNQNKPIKKIISINYLSQCLTSIVEKNPSKARSNPTILTKKESDYDRLFPDRRPMETYLQSIKIMKRIEQFIKQVFKPTDEVDVALSTYYHFHISRVLVSVILNQARFNGDRDLCSFNIEDITDEIIFTSYQFTKELVLNYSHENAQNNLTYVSKQIPFSEYINNNISDLLTK